MDANGGGAWELAARYSHTDATDAGITGGVMDISSLGLNWWLSTSFVTSVNYRWIDHEIGGVQGHTQGLVGRIMLVLE